MKRRRTHTRDFKISVIREVEMGKEGKGERNGKGGENIESFKYCFLTSCILTGVHPRIIKRGRKKWIQEKK